MATIAIGLIATGNTDWSVPGGTWQLIEFGEPGAYYHNPPRITFHKGSNEIEGHDGCNTIGASYRAAGNRILIFGLGQTQAGCLRPPGAVTWDTSFTRRLVAARKFKFVDGGTTLVLQGDETELKFRNPDRPGFPTPVPSPTPAAFTLEISTGRAVPPFDPADWEGWIDADGDCLDTRAEVLIAESLVPVTIKDCAVVSGEWLDPFTNTTTRDPGELEISHMVPLANAHRSGGWAWDAETKRSFANDLSDPAHLVAVSKDANSLKGNDGPDKWMPETFDQGRSWCVYLIDWMRIKAQWGLKATGEEFDALQEWSKRNCHPRYSPVELRSP